MRRVSVFTAAYFKSVQQRLGSSAQHHRRLRLPQIPSTSQLEDNVQPI